MMKLIQQDKETFYIQMIEQKSITKIGESGREKKFTSTYYYPSEREDSCSGKGRFKPRFQKIKPGQERNFCQIFCNFMCLLCCEKKVNVPEDMDELQILLPMSIPTFPSFQNKITYTWIGHSTAVINIAGKVNLMIDPVFSQRCSPFQWIGPKRYRKPACQPNKLPQIHAVFVSHDHYDHLDQQSLSDLQQLYKPIFFAGLDSSDTFPQGCKLIEMDWTETKKVNINSLQFQITFVPVCHWSKRKVYQKNTRLWGGFVIKTPNGRKIFYSGDTAYCEIFKQLGQIFGPFDLSILPIGAYLPRYIMSPSHNDPEEAVIMHQQLKSKKTVGVHWGTFPLGFEHYHQPRQDLQKAKTKHNIKPDEFVTVAHGESFSIDYL